MHVILGICGTRLGAARCALQRITPRRHGISHVHTGVGFMGGDSVLGMIDRRVGVVALDENRLVHDRNVMLTTTALQSENAIGTGAITARHKRYQMRADVNSLRKGRTR